MTAPPRSDYDLKAIDVEDTNVDPTDWNFRSAFNEKMEYKLMSKEPLDYFDFKPRFLVKPHGKAFYAYCVQFNSIDGSMQEDLIADYLYMKSLTKRYPSRFLVYDDLCLE